MRFALQMEHLNGVVFDILRLHICFPDSLLRENYVAVSIYDPSASPQTHMGECRPGCGLFVKMRVMMMDAFSAKDTLDHQVYPEA